MRLELFDVRRRRPRQHTQRDDERGLVNCGILFSLSSSVQFVGLILPSNSHAEIKTRLYASAIFPISGDWDVLLPLIWNGLCDRRRAEITVMQFTGLSLFRCIIEVGPSPCPILSAEHTCALSFDYWPLGCVTSTIFGIAGVIIIERK